MAQVPSIDRLAGIEHYCTCFAGTGGSIKASRSGFKVAELVAESLAREISQSYDEQHRYPIYLLQKEGLDSNHALMEIERKHHLRLRVMGIKDARAVTVQYAGSSRAMRDPPGQLTTEHCRLTLKGFTRRPLQKEFLSGNEFRVEIYDSISSELKGFLPEIARIGNFYGLQRFGSERLVTHLVGREIVKRNFGRAVELLISYTTEHDTAHSREIRQECADPANYARLAKTLPRGMDIERSVISALAEGKDAISALRAVPITTRRLFVQAYQAFIFNRCLSKAVGDDMDLLRPEPADLCFEMDDPITFGRIVKFENAAAGRQVVPAIRLAGYSFQPGRGRFDAIVQSVLDEDSTVPKNFYLKEMQELSQQGGFRQAPLCCTEFKYATSPRLWVSFRLPKGSYATTLLRELIKPQDPIKSGF